jgi:hypothetical protein
MGEGGDAAVAPEDHSPRPALDAGHKLLRLAAMKAPFDLWHEDGLLFDDHPELFVLLDRTPIIWTVRGLRHFRPRFALTGVDIKTIRARDQFEHACSRWLAVEKELLLRQIATAAASPSATLEARCLDAIAHLDLETAEALVSELESLSGQRHGLD